MINYQLSLRLAAFQTQTVIDSWKQKRQKCFQAHLEREVMWICACRDHVSTASSRAEQHSIFTVQSKSCFFFLFFLPLLLAAVCRARRYKRLCDERLMLLNIDKVGWKTMSERAERWLMESERAGERLLSAR